MFFTENSLIIGITHQPKVLRKGQSIMQLNTDDLIELAEKGKAKNIELDDMAKEVFSECAYMMKFERDCYLKGKKKNAR